MTSLPDSAARAEIVVVKEGFAEERSSLTSARSGTTCAGCASWSGVMVARR